MTKPVNRNLPSRRDEWNKPEQVSFAELNILVRQQVAEITSTQEHIQRAYDLFSTRSDIGHGECDYLLTNLQTISASACTFYELFKDPLHNLPHVVISFHYPLAAELAAIEQLIKGTVQVTSRFRSAKHMASNTIIRQRCTIISNLEEILEACNEIKMRALSMLDLARFQHSRLKQ